MNVASVMDELADRLGVIPGLRIFAYPPDTLTPPAAVVSYPDEGTYDASYGRGMDTMTLPIVVVVGRVSDRSSRDQLTAYVDGAGTSSIKAAIDGPGSSDAFDTVRVTGFDVDVVTIGGSDYLAATFNVDVAGAGSG